MENGKWDKILERAPLFLIVIGILTVIVGAVGGIPFGNPPLIIDDGVWRIGIALIGTVIIIVSLYLIIREERSKANNGWGRPSQGGPLLVKTYPRSQHPAFFAEVERLVPKANEITLIATGLNLIWEKRILDILLERAKFDQAKITICMGNPFNPHVLDRLVEEEMSGQRAPVGKDGIAGNIKALITRLEAEGSPANFKVCLFEHYPTFATLIFDKEIFIYPYAYQQLGNLSPIIHLHDNESEEAKFFLSNANRIIQDASPAKDIVAVHNNRKYYSSEWIAVAVYLIPDSSESLYKYGSKILGFDVRRQTEVDDESLNIQEIRKYVGEAAQYGMHVTIADALYFANEAQIKRISSELQTLVEEFHPFTLSNFRIVDRFADVGDIVMLCEDTSGVTEAIHGELLSKIYKSALSSNYLTARTRKRNPSPLERSTLLLQRFGSPYILKKFDPHFTLCAAPPTDEQVREQLVAKLNAEFEKSVKDMEIEFDKVCLLTKRHNDKYWKIVAEYELPD